jgi:hypothetical protein
MEHLDNVTREGIRNILRASAITITFTKNDGSVREMRCTLNESFIPKVEKAETTKERAVNPEVCPVWDIDKQAWRSFRWDSITKIEV